LPASKLSDIGKSWFSRWNFLLSYGLNLAAFKNDIRGENSCLFA
jgi:hypothetical protein